MSISPALAASIAVFRELGWDATSLSDVMDLPLGTPQQRRIAKAGLERGDWGEFAEHADGAWGWQSWLDVDADLLAVFALRQGVSARRVSRILSARVPLEVRAALIAERGPAFTAALAERGGLHATALIVAVAETGVEVPANLEYLDTWMRCAAWALGDGDVPPDAIPAEIIERRFADHLRQALRSGGPAPRRWGGPAAAAATDLVVGGIERGWIEAAEVRELVLFAIDQARRPSDRIIWASVLTDALQPDEAWLHERAGVLLAAISFGDDAVIERFSPVLLRTGDDDVVAQTMLIGLTAKSAKAKASLLSVAAGVPAPGPETAALVGEAVAPLRTAKDRALAKNAQALVDAWVIEIEPEMADDAPTSVLGLWQETPRAAPVPRFDPGPVTPDHLTALASVLSTTGSGEGITLDVERFLATANALALVDAESARTALRGVRRSSRVGVHAVEAWVKGEADGGLDRNDPQRPYIRPPAWARDASVFQRLGEVPTLLSTPSWDDYRIDPAELADRLDAYAAVGASALEADLTLALPRIDLELWTEPVASRLAESAVPIVMQDGSLLEERVGHLLEAWRRQPLVHPGFSGDQSVLPAEVATVPALASLPARLTEPYVWAPITIFPTWPEARIADRDPAPATLRHRPNGVAPSTQLLDHVGEDAVSPDAAIAAWRAGVLLPGVAEAPRLGWNGQIPSLAARAEPWAELAQEGMLSVIWPLAHDAIAYSSRGPRVAPGVDALVDLLARFLPEVQAAVAAGNAPPSALDLPAVRALAERGGSSRAVVAARSLAALLPPLAPAAEPAGDEILGAMDDDEFRAAWPAIADPPVVGDRATLTLEENTRMGVGTFLQPTVVLADGHRHTVESVSWLYPLVREFQMPTSGARASSWLRYRAQDRALVAGPERDDPTRTDADRELTHTLVQILLLTQHVQNEPPVHELVQAIRDGMVGPTRIAAAIDELLVTGQFDPSRVVRRLPRHPEALSALYPVLTRSIRYAATLTGSPPRWLVRIIDVATEFAPVLREAGARGLLVAEDASWAGLDVVASASGSPTARRKATALIALLDPAPARGV